MRAHAPNTHCQPEVKIFPLTLKPHQSNFLRNRALLSAYLQRVDAVCSPGKELWHPGEKRIPSKPEAQNHRVRRWYSASTPAVYVKNTDDVKPQRRMLPAVIDCERHQEFARSLFFFVIVPSNRYFAETTTLSGTNQIKKNGMCLVQTASIGHNVLSKADHGV